MNYTSYDYSNCTKCYVHGSIKNYLDTFIRTIMSNIKVNTDDNEYELDRSFINDSVIIVNGSDFLFEKSKNYYLSKLGELNDILRKNNIVVLLIRGIDNPDYFKDDLLHLSNIKTIDDNSVVKLNDFNCLCIGGYSSLDRKWRIKQSTRLGKKLFWDDEEMKIDEDKIKSIIEDVDIECVIMPNAPSFAKPINEIERVPWFKDKEIKDNFLAELKQTDSLFKLLHKTKKLQLWFFSRFNLRNRIEYSNCIFNSVKNNELRNITNIILSNKAIKEATISSRYINLSEEFIRNAFTLQTSSTNIFIDGTQF